MLTELGNDNVGSYAGLIGLILSGSKCQKGISNRAWSVISFLCTEEHVVCGLCNVFFAQTKAERQRYGCCFWCDSVEFAATDWRE